MTQKTLSEIPYLDILKRAFQLAWKNKFLWILGIFVALIHSDSISYYSDFSGSGKDPLKDIDPSQITAFWEAHWQVILTVAGIVILLCIILGILATIARGGLIHSISKLEKNEVSNWKDGVRAGKKYFGKILGMNLLIFFSVLVILIVISLPSAYCFLTDKPVAGALTAIPALIIFLLIAIISGYLRIFGQIYIATSEIGILPALDNAYKLFRKNFWASIVMSLFFIPLGLAFGIAVLLILLALAIIFLIPGIPLWLIFKETGITIGLVVAIPVAFAVLTLFSAIYKVFEQAVWFLFFKEIATEKSEEVLEEIKEEEAVILPKSEPASPITPSEIE
ncbi:MAG: DUF7544 domain-containing protein [Patescibacteria group bacterium]